MDSLTNWSSIYERATTDYNVCYTIKKCGLTLLCDIFRQILVEIDSTILSPQRMDMPFFKAPSIASTDDIMTPPAGAMITGVSRDYIDSDYMMIIILLSKILAF
jgi:hypothetical protein